MRIETVFSLRTQVCGLKKMRKRQESYFRDRQSLICRGCLQPLGRALSRLPASLLPRSHAASQGLLQYRRVLHSILETGLSAGALCVGDEPRCALFRFDRQY